MPMAHPGFSVLSDAFEADPYRHFARLREQAPVHHEPAIDSYFLSRHQDVRRVLTDHRAFTTETLQARAEPVMRGPVLAQMTGAEHTAKRKIVVQGLTGEALREQMNTVRARAAELLAPLLARGRMDLVADFGKPFAVQVTMDVLGLDVEDWRQVAAWHSGVAEFITGLTLTPERRRHCLECAEQLEAHLVPVIEERRREPGPDLISRLCAAEFDSTALSVRDVTALIINVLAAATEPADKTLALLFKHLIDQPEQLTQVRRDPALLPAAIAETLRLTPPSPRRSNTAACAPRRRNGNRQPTRRPSTHRGRPSGLASRSSAGRSGSGVFWYVTGRSQRSMAVAPTEVVGEVVAG